MRAIAYDPTLVELSFESTALPGVPLAAWQRLASYTHEVNPRLGLTGELAMAEGGFHAVVEGRAEVLMPLAARILSDGRHRAIRMRRLGSIALRRFNGWMTHGFGLDGAESLRFAAQDAGDSVARRAMRLVAQGNA